MSLRRPALLRLLLLGAALRPGWRRPRRKPPPRRQAGHASPEPTQILLQADEVDL